MPVASQALPSSPSRRRLLGIPTGTAAPAPMRAAATLAAQPPAAVRWLTKATYGHTAADLMAFNALGANDNARWAAWLDQQLNPAGINDSACQTRINTANYVSLNKTVPQLWADHHESPDWSTRMLPQEEVECATVIRAIYSQRQLFERMVGFWHDHFNVYSADGDTGPMYVHYDRDVIRTHALGNFRTMLGAVARSPSMLFYLDNYDSRGANFNENYARELIELHTLGVENYYGANMSPWHVPCIASEEVHCDPGMPAGFVDNDVYEAAAALTGWSLKNGYWEYPNDNDGTFVYRPEWHQHNNKLFLGLWMPANQPAMEDGEQVFDRLCQHPGTARHIAGKLCRRFVGDNPSQGLIDSVAADFANHRNDGNQIALMLRTILESTEFKATWGEGMRRPFESTMSALRALGAEFTPKPDDSDTWTVSEEFFGRLQQTGHRPFRWVPPNGYPDNIEAWSSSGSLGMTLRLLRHLPRLPQDRSSNPPPLADIVGQTQAALPAIADRTASNIIAFWCQQILGWQPQPLTTTLTAFLQQDALASEPLDLSIDDWDSSLKDHYVPSRLRTAVGMLLMNPHFLLR